MKRLLPALTVLAAALLSAAPASARPTARLAPASGIVFGMYARQTPANQQTNTLAVEREAGRKFFIDRSTHAMSSDWYGGQVAWDEANGRVPFLNIPPVSSSQIASGAYDAQLRHEAAGIKALPHPLMLSYGTEMDRKPAAGTPAQFVAAWQHMWNLFQASGANANTVWVWCPTGSSAASGKAFAFYPGDQYVDWACFNAYNWGSSGPGGWRSPAQTYGGAYQGMLAHDTSDKPILVSETGVDPRGGDKAKWMLDARDTIKRDFPNIEAIIYFNKRATDAKTGLFYDWPLETPSAVIPAFSAWVNDPYYMAQPGGSAPAPAPAPVPAPDAPPSAPASIATSTYQTSINVSWGEASDDVGIAGYRVYLGATQVAQVDAATTSTTIASGVACGTRYDVSVAAVDSAGSEGARAARTAYTVKC